MQSPILLVSSTGDEEHAGGVFAVGEGGCELLDRLPTSGMAISPDGSRLARLTWIEGHTDVSELLVSDRAGLLGYRRLDEVSEPHSIMWLGDELHAVSTGSNSVVTLDEAGRPRRTWRAPGAPAWGDCWHLNSLVVTQDRILVSAFGRFATLRGWSEPGALDGSGLVVDIATAEVVLSGLSAPHDPTPVEDGWLICNSLTGEVWRLDSDGHRRATAQLGGWTRGLLVDGEAVYVGVSAHRLAAPVDRASIAVLDRTSLQEIGRFEMPTRDVFSLCQYDARLANGLQVGTNLGVTRNLGSPAVLMETPLPEVDSVVRLQVLAVASRTVTVRVTNQSSVIMTSFGKHPVRVGARWWDASANAWVDVARADLSEPLYPSSEATLRIELPVWPPVGTPLRIGVLQEMVRWFDEVGPAAAVDVCAG